MENYINLGVYQILAAYLLPILVFFLVRMRNKSTNKLLIISCLRMTFQLILLGYILTYIFKIDSGILSIVVVGVMELFAVFNIFKMCKFKISTSMKKVIGLSFAFGTLSGLLFFVFVIVQLEPWYTSSYFIPLAGMLIGNSMTGVTLGINNLNNNMWTQRELVENALALGADPKEACKHIVNDSFDSAILPTINSMLGMGIVFIPGMMASQILAGIMPVNAIKYQLVIMLGILGSVAISSIFTIVLSHKTYFNKDKQFIINKN